jgi:hypothetical protein
MRHVTNLFVGTLMLLLPVCFAWSEQRNEDAHFVFFNENNRLDYFLTVQRLRFVEDGFPENEAHFTTQFILNGDAKTSVTLTVLRKDGGSNVCILEPESRLIDLVGWIADTDFSDQAEFSIEFLKTGLTVYEFEAALKIFDFSILTPADITSMNRCDFLRFDKDSLTPAPVLLHRCGDGRYDCERATGEFTCSDADGSTDTYVDSDNDGTYENVTGGPGSTGLPAKMTIKLELSNRGYCGDPASTN